ncbi:hypothetical protein F5878DRAFT_647635 [Lentinula raphanica]|uniref:Uncharacterized protein n=1 Tax=Lentinula raphanica TaxID=153919 RepID=A0AA38NVK2_9AGAR|nr:hypothetical protein F5878DRAFT_647635 [Lentinula raphanica]
MSELVENSAAPVKSPQQMKYILTKNESAAAKKAGEYFATWTSIDLSHFSPLCSTYSSIRHRVTLPHSTSWIFWKFRQCQFFQITISLNNCPVSLLRTGVVLSPKGYIEYRGSYPGSKDILEESTRLVEETWAACFEKDCVTTGINSKHRNPDQRSVPSVQFFKNKLDSRIGYPTTRDLGAKVDWGTEENRQAYFRRFKAIPETQTLPLLNAIFKILVDDRMLYTESATGKQVLEDLPPEWLKHDRAMKSAIRKLQDLAN